MGANAQTTVPTFTIGQVLTAAQMNASARTGVPVFATTTDRDAAFGGTGEKTLAEGQVCYIEAAPKRLQIYDGTNWLDFDVAYQSFTPTWTNLTVGNATQNFQYCRFGKFVHYFGNITLGSTSSVSGAIRFSNPVNADSALTGQMFAFCEIQDTGTATLGAAVAQQAAGTFEIYALNVAGTYPTAALTSSTIPMSWTNTDEITFNIVYKAA